MSGSGASGDAGTPGGGNDPRLVEAVAAIRGGDLDHAECRLRELLRDHPENTRVHLGLGMVALGRGDHATALAAIDRALALDPRWPANHLYRAQALIGLQRFDEASATIATIADAASEDPRLSLCRAAIARGRGDRAAGLEILQSLVAARPDWPDGRRALARALIEWGNAEDALALVQPMAEDADAQNLAGTILESLGKQGRALSCYRAAVDLNPRSADAQANLGTVLDKLGRTADGLAPLEEASRLHPARIEIQNNLAIVLNRLDRSAEAAARLSSAIATARADGSVHPGLLTNLANAHALCGRIELACDAHREAAALMPSEPVFLGNLMFDLHFDPRIDGSVLMQALAGWGQRFGPVPGGPLSPPPPPNQNPGRTLRVGYVCADFRNHSNASVFGPLILGHDPAALSVMCYSGGAVRDDATDRLRAKAAGWVETDGLSHRALADRIRADGIDILVDLSGHTQGSRLEAFGYRPAPIQLSWVNATGHPDIDWVLTDGWMWPPPDGVAPVGPGDPSESAAEPPWRLPIGALPFRLPVGPPPFRAPEAPAVADGPSMRGAPPVFGCFNNLMKLNDPVIECWAGLVAAAPGARLLLKVPALDERAVAEEIRARFAAAGLSADRLVLHGRTGRRTHMAAYAAVDVALDPFPGNGGATTWEALWMGVPVVCLTGDRPNGRAGASILGNLGLSALVAPDRAAYVDLAVRLIRDRDRLTTLRRSLRDIIQAAPGIGEGAYAATVTAAYREMFVAYNRTKGRV